MSRALIVDNDAPVRLLLNTILSRQGFSCTEATDGAEALHILGTQRFDLIVLDLMMPVVSGEEVIEHLARTQQRKNIIVLTATSDKKTSPIVSSPCVYAVIRKPFDLTHLLETVRGATRKRVLFVEDDEATQYLVGRDMTNAGYAVTIAGNGQEALRSLRDDSYDALVVDLRLPVISGYDVIDHVISKADPPPPLIVLSILRTPERPLPPVAAYLHKPHEMAKVVTTLRTVM
ncbi:MAG TPA: response regulator [Thermoanaerobaculia bacterium]|jgi:CheY-like chemotaxis protein|nr:response regulator [Thermoanaerobaculia bacterium]